MRGAAAAPEEGAMNVIGFVVVAALSGLVGLVLWRRHRGRRLRVTHHRLRCPISGDLADVAVATDPAAPSARQYAEVTDCSLHPAVRVDLPERAAYLWDGPPCRVRLDPPRRGAVCASRVPCGQECVFVLNATAVSGTPAPLECRSGTSDAMALATEAVGNPRIARLLWYASV
jgi:hypothetical protein